MKWIYLVGCLAYSMVIQAGDRLDQSGTSGELRVRQSNGL